MSRYEVLDDLEGTLIRARPKRQQGPAPEMVEIIEELLSRKTLFLPGKSPTTVTTIRYWMTHNGRRLITRSGQRGGEEGVYIWMGPPIE